MKEYYFRLYQCGDEDGDTVWTRAESWSEAESNIYSDYHSIDKLDRLWDN